MPRMNVMDAVIKVLESEGVRYIFGVPGAAILPFYDALRKSTQIKHLIVRHEEGARTPPTVMRAPLAMSGFVRAPAGQPAPI